MVLLSFVLCLGSSIGFVGCLLIIGYLEGFHFAL